MAKHKSAVFGITNEKNLVSHAFNLRHVMAIMYRKQDDQHKVMVRFVDGETCYLSGFTSYDDAIETVDAMTEAWSDVV